MIDKLLLDLAWYYNLTRPRKNFKLPFIILKNVLVRESFSIVFFYRFSYYFHDKIRLISKLLEFFIKIRYSSTISSTAEMKGGLRFPHPYGITIGGGVIIDRMVTIGQNVTIGGNFGIKNIDGRTTPKIGAWSVISANSVIAGPIKIGKDVIIGANSVVTKNIDCHMIASGNPVRVLREKEVAVDNKAMRILNQIYFGYSRKLVEEIGK
ncbi:hypothetical protein [Oceanihabitans sediminis]|uniref:hypothetical protein n=1 Tax=Oceanihabitans sediminis TaxID=1812012 RepID=UPI00299D8B18|nr:hypothetical protein [Oceanihabitans sediminis]MDX1774864.1 hypothetical protein [Oceanihabitans sediminis]